MIIDVDEPKWLDRIRIANLVLSEQIELIRISSGGDGLHLFSREDYYEPIECIGRAFFRDILGFEITFDSKGGDCAEAWFAPDLSFVFEFDSFQGYGVK